MGRLILTGIFCLLFTLTSKSQEVNEKKEVKAANGPYHRITIMMANVHIPATYKTNDIRKSFIVPAWGFDYDYWFNGKWAIGFHNDLILQQYKVEKIGEEKELIRNFPVSMALVGLYKPGKHLVIVAGVGREFEKNESINLIDLGIEYGWELPKNYELGFNLKYEYKINAYNSYLFGISISKILETK